MRTSHRFAAATAAGVAVIALLTWAVLATYHPLRPRIMCQMPLGTGQVAVYFGYSNQLDEPLSIPVGEDNRLSPWARTGSLPTVFAPGSSGAYPDAAFVATFRPSDVPAGETLSWRLGTRTVRLTDETPRCPVKPFKVAPEDVVWVRPKPVEIAKLEPPPVVVPEPEPAPPEPTRPPETKPEPTPPPPRAERRPPRPKPQNEPVASVKSDAPVALALTGLTNAPGGMAIQSGEFDSLGRADVVATRDTTAPREPGRPDGVDGGTGDVAKPAPKRVPARVKVRPRGEWPADAPPRAGAVLVRLSLLVGTDGRVKEVKVVRKAGPAFDREARAVGMKAVFDPATVDGEPVESWVPWDVEFTPDSW
jgi:protein TonB